MAGGFAGRFAGRVAGRVPGGLAGGFASGIAGIGVPPPVAIDALAVDAIAVSEAVAALGACPDLETCQPAAAATNSATAATRIAIALPRPATGGTAVPPNADWVAVGAPDATAGEGGTESAVAERPKDWTIRTIFSTAAFDDRGAYGSKASASSATFG